MQIEGYVGICEERRVRNLSTLFWKAIIRILRICKKDFTRAVKCGKQIYIIKFEKYISVEEKLNTWKNALGKPKAQD